MWAICHSELASYQGWLPSGAQARPYIGRPLFLVGPSSYFPVRQRRATSRTSRENTMRFAARRPETLRWVGQWQVFRCPGWWFGEVLGRMVMFRTRVFLAILVAWVGMEVPSAMATPVDVGSSPESARKAALHLRVYNEQPKAAFDACRGRASGTSCTYSVTPMGTAYTRQVEGSCWAPETPRKVALVCR